MKEIIIWSKDRCPYCDIAKDLLKSKNLEFQERNVSNGDWSVEQLKEAVPNARTVPQIVIDGNIIGGSTDLTKYINEELNVN